ncbi:hypothetical protein KEM52_003097, partial [Ascosphaera acerosa]
MSVSPRTYDAKPVQAPPHALSYISPPVSPGSGKHILSHTVTPSSTLSVGDGVTLTLGHDGLIVSGATIHLVSDLPAGSANANGDDVARSRPADPSLRKRQDGFLQNFCCVSS